MTPAAPVRSLAPLLLLLAILAPALAGDGRRTVAGTLDLPGETVLPAGAVAVVAVAGEDGASLAEAQVGAARDRLPLPFEIAVPAEEADAVLRAVVRVDGAPRWVSPDVPLAAGAGAVRLGAVVLAPHAPMGFSTALACGDTDVAVGFFGENAVVEIGGRRTVLPPVAGSGGRRFAGGEDPAIALASEGGRVSLTIDGRALPPCRPR